MKWLDTYIEFIVLNISNKFAVYLFGCQEIALTIDLLDGRRYLGFFSKFFFF
jgi:hypothetical protein